MAYNSLLTLDLATRSGFCHWNPGVMPTIGSKDMSWAWDDLGKFLHCYEKWLRKFLVENHVDWVTFEAPILVRKGYKTTSIQTAYKLMNLCGTTERVCFDMDVVCSEVRVSEWRKHFLGHGGYPTEQAKKMCMERAFAAGLNPKFHDEAEAFGIMDYTADQLEIKKQWRDGGLLGLMR